MKFYKHLFDLILKKKSIFNFKIKILLEKVQNK